VVALIAGEAARLGIAVDPAGLPDGARRLLGLAERAPHGPPPPHRAALGVLARIGIFVSRGGDELIAGLAFLGSVTRALARAARGRASPRWRPPGEPKRSAALRGYWQNVISDWFVWSSRDDHEPHVHRDQPLGRPVDRSRPRVGAVQVGRPARIRLVIVEHCITMSYMASTKIVTVRIDPALLAALKASVRREGSTVSGAIVEMVRAKLGPARPRRHAPTMGMFAGQFDDLELADFKRERRSFSARMRTSARPPRR
jgi:hypothetical protein